MTMSCSVAVSRVPAVVVLALSPAAQGTVNPPACAEASTRAGDREVESLLEQAGRYVVEYQQSFSKLVAEETYTQWVRTKG
jgi:hypothetical protein